MIKAVIYDMYETLITHYKSPLYFSPEMAEDAGMDVNDFLPYWRKTEQERWIGTLTFEDTITTILKQAGCYSDAILEKIVKKRTATKEEGFRHLHPDILPMLEELKKRQIKIGLISNCFSEEAAVIRKSILFPYFDGVCLSYEQGVQKPDPEIYERCIEKLKVRPEECLYVGDGGCMELESAQKLGMHPLQACWYFQEGLEFQSKRDPAFKQAENPMDVLKYLQEV